MKRERAKKRRKTLQAARRPVRWQKRGLVVESLEDRRLLCSAPADDDHAALTDDGFDVCDIQLSEPLSGTTNYPSDRDAFRLQTTEPGWYEVVVDSPGFDGVLAVFDAERQQIGSRRGSHLNWNAEADTTYFVSLFQYDTGDYNVVAQPVLDDYTDIPGEGLTQLSQQESTSGILAVPGDVDILELPVGAGEVYQLEFASSYDHLLSLDFLSDDGTVTLMGGRADSRDWVWRATSDGPRFLSISSQSSLRLEYSLILQPGDDFPSSPEGAGRIVDNGFSDGEIELPGDVDWFAFEANPDSVYRIQGLPRASELTFASNQLNRARVRVFDPSGVDVIEPSWRYSDSDLSFRPGTASTYYIAMSGYGQASGEYRLVVNRDSAEEIVGDPPTEPILILGAPNSSEPQVSTHVITDPNAPVSLEFHALLPGKLLYDIEVRPRTVAGTRLRAYDQDGELLGEDSSSGMFQGSRLVLQPTSPVVRLEVGAFGEVGAFDVSIATRSDDHPDSLEGLTALALNENHTGELTASDRDILKFNVTPGRYYTLTAGYFDPRGTKRIRLRGLGSPSEHSGFWRFTRQATSPQVIIEFLAAQTPTPWFVTLTEVIDEFPDTQDVPVLVPLNEAIEGEIQHAADVDLLAFDAEAGDGFRFSVNGASASVISPNGSSVSIVDGTRWSTTETGTHFLSLTAGFVLDYVVQIDRTSQDDHGNFLDETATTIVAGNSYSLVAETSNDIDVFAFDAVEGQGYEFSSPTEGRGWIYIHGTEPNVVLTSHRLESGGIRWNATTTGRYYVEVRYAKVSTSLATFALVPDDHPDTFENMAAIQGLTAEGVAEGTFEVQFDVDLFRFESDGNEWLQIQDLLQAGTQPTITYFAADGSVIESTRGPFRANASGDYFFAIDNSQQGSYRYRLNRVADDFPDGPVPNAESRTGLIKGQLENSRDRDYIPVDVASSDELIVSASRAVYLRDPEGNFLRGGTTFIHRPTLAGRVYVEVPDSRQVPLDYELNIFVGPDPPTARDELAIPLEPGVEVRGFNSRSDWDTYRFEVTAGQEIAFDSLLTWNVYDFEGNALAPLDYKRVWRAESAGTYYATARGPNTAEALYFLTLEVNDPIVDDFPEFPGENVSLLPSGESITGQLHQLTDRDVFAIDVVHGEVVELLVAGDVWSQLAVVDANDEIQANTYIRPDATEERLRWKAPTTGRYFVALTEPRIGVLSEFSVTRTRLALDDHADTGLGATPIGFGEPITVFVDSEFVHDTDVLSFQAKQGNVYNFATSNHNLSGEIRSDTDRLGSFRGATTWTATQSGTTYLWIRGPLTATVTVREFVDNHPDARELATTTLTTDASVSGLLHPGTDIDWFIVDAEIGQYRVDLETDEQTPVHRAGIQIVDQTGTIVAEIHGSVTWFEVEQGSSYFLSINGNSGNYRIALSPVNDDHHNFPADGATPLKLGQAQAGELETTIDRDVFAIALEAGRGVEAKLVSGTLNIASSTLRIFDSNGQLVVAPQASEGRFLTELTQTYFVEVSATNRGSYDIVVRYDEEADDHGNSIAAATPLKFGEPVDAVFEFANDIDYFAVDIVEPLTGIQLKRTLGTVSADDINWQFFDEEGNSLPGLSTYNGQGGTFKFDVAGTYLLRAATRESGTYRVEIATVEDDFPDSPLAVNVPLVSGSINGNLEVAGDVDVFAYEGRLLDSVMLPNHPDVSVELVDQDGQVIARNSDGNSWKIPQDATYYFLIFGKGQTSYSFRIATETDDFGDNTSQAHLLTHRENISGTLSSNDVDYFAVDIGAEGGYVTILNFEGFLVQAHWVDALGNRMSNFDLGAKLPGPGRFYLQVQHLLGPTTPRAYSFQTSVLHDLPDGPSNNTLSLEEDTPFTLIALPGDKDTYYVDLQRGDTARFSVTPVGMGLQIMTLDGTELAQGTTTVSWKANVGGRYYVVLDPHQDEGTLSYLYRITFEKTTDDLPDEPILEDNFPQLVSDQTRTAQLTNRDDVDVLAMPVAEDELVVVTVRDHHHFSLRIIDRNGIELARSTQDTIYWRSPSENTVYFAVAAGSAVVQNATYQLQRTKGRSDDWPNVPGEDAPLLQLDEKISGYIEASEIERDVFAFEVTEPGKYRVDFSKREVEGEPDTPLPVRVAAKATDGITPVPVDSRDHVWIADSPGRYFLELSTTQEIGAYEFKLTPVADDYPDVATASLTDLRFDAEIMGNRETLSDVDVFRLDLTESRIVRIELTSDSGNARLALESEQTTSVSRGILLRRLQPGTYQVRVYNGSGPYTLRMQEVLDDAPDDLVVDAPRLEKDVPRSATIDASDDKDVFTLDAMPGETLTATVESESRLVIAIHAADGTELSQGVATATAKIPAGGFAYVTVLGQVPSDYQISVSLAGDDHNDRFNEAATFLAIDATSTGLLELPRDVDVFAIDVAEGKSYRAWLSHLPAFSSIVLELYDAQGSRIDRSTSGFLDLQLRQQGRYYLAVSSYQIDVSFSIAISETTDDLPAWPTIQVPALTIEQPLLASGDFFKDLDVASFAGRKGDVVFISSDTSVLSILDIDGNQLASSGHASFISWKVPETATYYVQHEALTNIGEYALQLRTQADDHGDELEQATIVAVTDSLAGTLPVGEDVDWFEVALAAGSYAVVGDFGNAQVRVWTATGEPLADQGESQGWVLPASQSVFVEVAHGEPSSPIPKTFELNIEATQVLSTVPVLPTPVTAASIDRLFARLQAAEFEPSLDYNQDSRSDHQDGQLYLRSHGVVLGDLNMNGSVSFEDFLRLSANYGSDGGWADGDITGDGKIQFDDFLLLAAHFGESEPNQQ